MVLLVALDDESIEEPDLQLRGDVGLNLVAPVIRQLKKSIGKRRQEVH